MIVIFYGTTAELIKLAALTKWVDRSEQLLICTAQQREQLAHLHKQLGVEPDVYLSDGWRGKDIGSMLHMLSVMAVAHGRFFKRLGSLRRKIRAHDKKNGTRSIGIVHGDTLTTVVGAYFARSLGIPVAHIEAGLRSHRLLHPFPEEIDRRVVSKIGRVHFSPGELPIANLKAEHTKGAIVDTVFNTSKDALEMADTFESEFVKSLQLPQKYGLVSIHRTELLERKQELHDFLKIVHKHASVERPLVFVDHTTTKQKIHALKFDHYLDTPGIQRVPKMPYMDFIQVVKGASYILTDSGGLQEDAYFLGVPTLIHRIATERNEGIGVNVRLSHLKAEVVDEFLKEVEHSSSARLASTTSPTKIIIDYLTTEKYIKAKA